MIRGEKQAPRWTIVAIALLTVVAALVRAFDLGNGLPFQLEADTVIVTQAKDLEHPKDEAWRNKGFNVAFYPLLLGQLLHALPGSSFADAPEAEATLESVQARASEPYLRGRILILLLSIPLVPLVWLLCRRWVGPEWALLAAAFLVVSYYHFGLSRSARPHAALTTACLLSMLATLRFLRAPGWGSALLAAGASALAVAVLHSGIFVLPSLMLAAFWADPTRPPRRWLRFLIGAVVLGATVYIFYPFFFDSVQESARKDAFNFGAQKLPLRRFNFGGYAGFLPNLYSIDPVLVLLGIAGLVPLWLHRARDRAGRRTAWVCIAHPLATILCFGITDHVPGRFFLPILPWFALSATIGVRSIAGWIAARWPAARPVARAACIALALAFPTAVIVRQVWMNARPPTQVRLVEWLAGRTEEIWTDNPVTYSLPSRVDVRGLKHHPPWSLSHWLDYQFMYLRNGPRPLGPRVHSLGPPAPLEEWLDLDAAGLREWFSAELGPALYLVRRGQFVSNRNPVNRLLNREKMIEAFGEPVYEDHGGAEPGEWADRGSAFPLSSRLRRLFLADRHGPSYEVWFVPAPG